MSERKFQLAWYAKASKEARISYEVLCRTIQQLILGQADDLGGGVFKKRLNENMHRSNIMAKTAEFWVFAYLLAKKDP